MKNQPKQLATPFAQSGDKQIIPNSGNFTDLSYASGYPPVYSQPLDQGGKEIERSGMNGIFYDLSDNIYAQQLGIPASVWRQYVPGTEQTTKILQEYQKGALVWYPKIDADDSSLALIRSKTDNNTDIPTDSAITVGSVQWEYVFSDFSPVVLTRGSRISKGINETTMKGFLKLAGQSLTDAQYAKIPADLAPSITVGGPGSWKAVDTRGYNQEILEQYQKDIYFVTKYANGEMEISGWCNYLYNPSVLSGTSVQQDLNFPESFVETPIIKIIGYNFANGELSEFNPDEYSKIVSYAYLDNAIIYIGSGNSNVILTTYFSIKGRWSNFFNTPITFKFPGQSETASLEIKNPLNYQGFFYSDPGVSSNTQVKFWTIFKETPDGENRYFDLFYLPLKSQRGSTDPIYLGVLDIVDEVFTSTSEFVLPPDELISFVDVTPAGKNSSNYTKVDQVLIEGSTTAIRLDNTKKTGLSFDNATLKINENNDLFVNLNPLHGAYSDVTKLLELTPDWSIIKNKPALAKKTDLETAITNVESMIPSVDDISLQIKDLTYTQPIGLPMMIINSIPHLVMGKLYYGNTLAQLRGLIYFIKGDLIFNGDLKSSDLEVANLAQSWTSIRDKPKLVTEDELELAVSGLEEEIPSSDNKTTKRIENELIVNLDKKTLIYDPLIDAIRVGDLNKVIFFDDNTSYIKQENGELKIRKQVLINKNAPKEIKLSIIFPIPFFLTTPTKLGYTVTARQCYVNEMKTNLFSNHLYLNMLRVDSAVTNAMSPDKVSLVFERVLPASNSYWIEFEISGYWRNLK